MYAIVSAVRYSATLVAAAVATTVLLVVVVVVVVAVVVVVKAAVPPLHCLVVLEANSQRMRLVLPT